MQKISSIILALALMLSFNPALSAHRTKDLLFEQDIAPGFKNAQNLNLVEDSGGNFVSENINSFINKKGDLDSFKFNSPKKNLTLIIETTNPELFEVFNKKRKRVKKRTTDSDNNLIMPLRKTGRHTIRVGRKSTSESSYSFRIKLVSSLDTDESDNNSGSCTCPDEKTGDDSSNNNDALDLNDITETIEAINFNNVKTFVYGSREDQRVFGYRFTIPQDAEGFYTIEAVSHRTDRPADEENILSRANVEISLINEDTDIVLETNSNFDQLVGSSNVVAKINRSLKAGDYLIKIKKVNFLTNGVVRLFLRPQDDHGNGIRNPSTLDLLAGGDLEYPGDTDFFKVGKLEPGKYRVEFEGEPVTSWAIFSIGSDEPVRRSYQSVNFLGKSATAFTVSQELQNTDGEWFLRVGNPASRNQERTGAYTIKLTNDSNNRKNLVFENDILPGFKNAQQIELFEDGTGDFISENIESAINVLGDIDSFQFNSPGRNLTLVVETQNPELFEVFNKKKKRVKKRTADSAGNIIMPLRKTGRHTIRVGRRNTKASSYLFRIRLTESIITDNTNNNPCTCPEEGNNPKDEDSNSNNEGNDPNNEPEDNDITGKIQTIDFDTEKKFIINEGEDSTSFKFSVGEDDEGFYTMEAVNHPSDGSSAERSEPFALTELLLLDARGKEIAMSPFGCRDCGLADTRSKINKFLKRGTYIVKVLHEGGFNTARAVRLFVRTEDDHGNGPENASTFDGRGGGIIGVPSDTDYFRIGKLIPGQSYNLNIKAPKLTSRFTLVYRDPTLERFQLLTSHLHQAASFPNQPGLAESNFRFTIRSNTFKIDPESTWYVRVGNSSTQSNLRIGEYNMQLTQE